MKQATFASLIDVSIKAAGEIERGVKFPKPEKLEPIAEALDVPLNELFKYGKDRLCPPPPELPTAEPRYAAKKAKKSPKGN